MTMKYIKKCEMHIAAIHSIHTTSCGVFFQFKITPPEKQYLGKGCKSSVSDFSGNCSVLYWFPE